MPLSYWQSIALSITQATGHAFSIQHHTAVSGGSINRAYRIEDQNRSYFVKLNRANRLAMFEGEAAGLSELASADAIRIPEVICLGQAADQSWLVTEYIAFGRACSDSMQELGRQMAALHRCTDDQFGWNRDNTIGLTEQYNQQSDEWVDFFREQRLRFQFELAARNGFVTNKG